MDPNRAHAILGVSRGASPKEIKRAYHAKARDTHPDKGGDAERFKLVQQAYEFLTQPQRDALHPRTRPPPAPAPTRIALPVTLDELFHGVSKRVAFERTRFPDDAEVSTCKACDGRGVVIRVIQFGRAIRQETRSTCAACQGSGKTAVATREKATVVVAVPKGSRHGHIVQMKGEGEQPRVGQKPVDLVFVVQQQSHPVWRRENDDLHRRVKISLGEALLGATFKLSLIGGREVRARAPGVVRPGQRMKLRGLGMHCARRAAGDVCVEFDVDFPTELSAAQRDAIALGFAESKGPEEEEEHDDTSDDILVMQSN